MTKKTCALLLAALWIGVSTYSQDITASNKAAFNRAIKAINANSADGAYTITVSGNFKINPASFADNAMKTVAIKGDGSIRTISNNKDKNALFTVPKGITLTLDNNITLNGNDKDASLVFVQGGSLVMRTGSTASGARGVGVHVGDGSFIMQGGAISGNSGGGVYVGGGSFTMSDGSISGNTASGRGGGVFVGGGSFTLEGGAINGNRANDGGGGGVFVGGGSFTLEGGIINGNRANDGMGDGGIYVGRGSFTMLDGTVSGNAYYDDYALGSHNGGGGVCVYYFGSFTMEGGAISGNTAYAGGGVCVSGSGTFTKQSGGIIYGSNASDVLKNTATSGGSHGHAVYVDVDTSPAKKRDSTAGAGVTLDSAKSGSSGGWE